MTGLFTKAKSAALPAPAPESAPAEGAYDYSMYAADTAAEEAAPAEKEEAPAPEEAPEGGWVAEEGHAADVPEAEAPEAEEQAAPEEEAPEAEAEEAPSATEIPSELRSITMEERRLDDLISTLAKKGISTKSSDDGYVLYVTDSNIGLLNEILSQYTDSPLSAGTTILIRKE